MFFWFGTVIGNWYHFEGPTGFEPCQKFCAKDYVATHCNPTIFFVNWSEFIGIGNICEYSSNLLTFQMDEITKKVYI